MVRSTKPLDGKFHIEVELEERGEGIHLEDPRIQIVKTSNGDVLPDDEPVILIRARDHLALTLLNFYRQLSIEDGCNDFHLNGVDEVIRKFADYANKRPERMKQPGITRGL
jgi:hypothetical protein